MHVPRQRRTGLRTVKWYAPAAAILILGSCGWFGGGEQEGTPPAGPPVTNGIDLLAQRPCDTEGFYELSSNSVMRDSVAAVAVSGEDLDKNEIHDCQQLLSDSTLGPLVGLLISRARVEGQFTDGQVVGEIVNYGSTAYSPLAIAPGISCLWIRQLPDSSWTAEIRRFSPGDNCISGPFHPRAQVLTVTRRTHQGADSSVYPSTGRWMWNDSLRVQFIGVRCGNGWCEMGIDHVGSKAPLLAADSVPGWYDEQVLSYAPDPGKPLQVSRLFGRIAPVPGLSRMEHPQYVDHFRGPGGKAVATITLTDLGADAAMLDAYRRKFDIVSGNTVTLHLRVQITAADDTVPDFRGGGTNWKAALYKPHVKHAPTGATRWAWNAVDEAGWTPCEKGCCQTDACLACIDS